MTKVRKKTFAVSVEGLEFDLLGETFKCTPELSYRTYMDHFEADNLKVSAKSVIDAIKAFLEDDAERDKFDRLINDDTVVVPFKTLLDIWTWVLTSYGVFQSPKED